MKFDGFDELLSTEMSRKQFLAHVGSGLLVVLGISGLLKALVGNKRPSQVVNGYGSSSYGGARH